MTVASDLCISAGAPLKIPPIWGSNGKIRWTPKSGGILRGTPVLLHKSESTVIESTPHIS